MGTGAFVATRGASLAGPCADERETFQQLASFYRGDENHRGSILSLFQLVFLPDCTRCPSLFHILLFCQVLLKIIKHCTESLPTLVSGSILGLEVGETLEVTNCYPFPAEQVAGESYQIDMMKMYRAVNVDNNCVGWYRSSYLGSFLTPEMLEQQRAHQEALGDNAPVIIFDPFQSSKDSTITVRAFRLTKAFLESEKAKGKGAAAAAAAKAAAAAEDGAEKDDGEEKEKEELDMSQILEEVPVKIRNSKLADMYLRTLVNQGSAAAATAKKGEGFPRTTAELVDFPLDTYLQKNIELMNESIAGLSMEMQKNLQESRQYQKVEDMQKQWMQKRTQENKDRELAGLEPFPEVNPNYKPVPAPSLVEAKLYSKQISTYASQMNTFAAETFETLPSKRS